MNGDDIESHGGIGIVVAKLSERIDSMDRETSHWRAEISTAMGHMTQQLSALSTRFSESRSANWPLIISFITLLIVICGLVLYPINNQLQEVRNQFRAHESIQMHPVGLERINAMERDLIKATNGNAESIAKLDAKQEAENTKQENLFNLQISALAKQFEEVRREGSPAIRERLALVESALKRLEK